MNEVIIGVGSAGLGIIVGLVVMFWAAHSEFFPKPQVENIDYKERWLAAVELLGGSGQLTEDQVKAITGEEPTREPVASRPVIQSVLNSTRIPSANEIKAIKSMATWDRKDAEIARAEAGLPPLDDLVGMATWDIRAVIQARAKASQ